MQRNCLMLEIKPKAVTELAKTNRKQLIQSAPEYANLKANSVVKIIVFGCPSVGVLRR